MLVGSAQPEPPHRFLEPLRLPALGIHPRKTKIWNSAEEPGNIGDVADLQLTATDGVRVGYTLSGGVLRFACAYPELLRAPRCRLVVLALKVAGRWSTEAIQFVRLCPTPSQHHRIVCATRPLGPLQPRCCRCRSTAPPTSMALSPTLPDLSDVLAEHLLNSPPPANRLPAR